MDLLSIRRRVFCPARGSQNMPNQFGLFWRVEMTKARVCKEYLAQQGVIEQRMVQSVETVNSQYNVKGQYTRFQMAPSCDNYPGMGCQIIQVHRNGCVTRSANE